MPRGDGKRLANPRDPAVRDALTRDCPTCQAREGYWCIGISEGPTKGKLVTRIHFDRCTLKPDPPEPPKPKPRAKPRKKPTPNAMPLIDPGD